MSDNYWVQGIGRGHAASLILHRADIRWHGDGEQAYRCWTYLCLLPLLNII
jgi:hypothetical protein